MLTSNLFCPASCSTLSATLLNVYFCVGSDRLYLWIWPVRGSLKTDWSVWPFHRIVNKRAFWVPRSMMLPPPCFIVEMVPVLIRGVQLCASCPWWPKPFQFVSSDHNIDFHMFGMSHWSLLQQSLCSFKLWTDPSISPSGSLAFWLLWFTPPLIIRQEYLLVF